MQIIRMTDDVVTTVEPIVEGDSAIVDERTPRIGSVLEGHHFMAPGAAALVVDGVVAQVAIGKYADEKPTPDTGKWIDTDRDVVPGFLYDADTGEFTAPEPPRDIESEVAGHALALKVGIVNATRTDGQTDDVTPEALKVIEKRYRAFTDKMNAKRTVDVALTDSEKATMHLIISGNEFFEAVDLAAATILAAGDAAEPVETDSRWPDLPTV